MPKGKGFPQLPFHVGVDKQPWFSDSRSPGEGSFKKNGKKKPVKKGK